MSDKKEYAIGIDIGGTTTKLGVVSRSGVIVDQDRLLTNENETAAEFVTELVKKCRCYYK